MYSHVKNNLSHLYLQFVFRSRIGRELKNFSLFLIVFSP